MALSRTVSEIQRLIGRKSRNFYTPPVVPVRVDDDPVGISERGLVDNNSLQIFHMTHLIGLMAITDGAIYRDEHKMLPRLRLQQ